MKKYVDTSGGSIFKYTFEDRWYSYIMARTTLNVRARMLNETIDDIRLSLPDLYTKTILYP